MMVAAHAARFFKHEVVENDREDRRPKKHRKTGDLHPIYICAHTFYLISRVRSGASWAVSLSLPSTRYHLPGPLRLYLYYNPPPCSAVCWPHDP